MTTFSQMVDSIVAETRRPDLRAEVIRYANQSIRECFFEPERNTVVFMRSAYREALVIPTSDVSASWDVPNPGVFQGVGAVRYANGQYAKMLSPGRRLDAEPYAFQNAGDRLIFKGYGGIGSQIAIAYYEFCRTHKYYDPSLRPAEFDIDLGWTYLPAFDVDDTTRLAARNMVSNWLLMGWASVLEEGLRAKVYKRVGDDARQRVSYSLWMQQRKGIISTEQAELIGVV